MLLWLVLLFGSVLSAPTDEFGEYVGGGDDTILLHQDELRMNIVPSGFPLHKTNQPINELKIEMPKLKDIDENNEHFKTLKDYVQKGVTMKGLTFNIYNDDMREAAVALFRLFQISYREDFKALKDWAQQNVNKEMYIYALRLSSLYGAKAQEAETLLPPFVWNPNYFVNSETIAKAAIAMDDIRASGSIDPQISKIYQYDYTFQNSEQFITINTNYSGWNLPKNGVDDLINYFREDVSLNSYYLGLHLLHPFWMSNDELDQINPRHAEYYYYAHQQLLARYLLEKEHLKNCSITGRDESDYVPYLSYKNGLPFPTRSCIKRNWDDGQALLKAIDIALKECISRGILIMENGTTINMTDDNHIDILARLIRGNLDSVKTAKVIRNLFGYGGNIYPVDEYNPAPSLMHHPETSLRDPAYWYLLEYMLKYFLDFKETMEPYDLSAYEDNEINIIGHGFTKIMSYFGYYMFPIDDGTHSPADIDEWPAYITVRQRRLKYTQFTLNFTVETIGSTDAVVRLYLGPQCGDNCWMEYSKFFEIDTFKVSLNNGMTHISWSPINSKRYFDYDNAFHKPGTSEYNMYKFPENLLIPRGLETGLNLTLFVMITAVENEPIPVLPSYYNEAITPELDSKPLGFPFHRQAKGFKYNASNYRFYNLTVYHKKLTVDSKGYFSPHLY